MSPKVIWSNWWPANTQCGSARGLQTKQNNTTQHNTTQHNTTQHNTTWSNWWPANTQYGLARHLQTTQHNTTWPNWWPATNTQYGWTHGFQTHNIVKHEVCRHTIRFSKRPEKNTQHGSNTHLMKTVTRISMFHCAFFNPIIDKHQHMHFTFNNTRIVECEVHVLVFVNYWVTWIFLFYFKLYLLKLWYERTLLSQAQNR